MSICIQNVYVHNGTCYNTLGCQNTEHTDHFLLNFCSSVILVLMLFNNLGVYLTLI